MNVQIVNSETGDVVVTQQGLKLEAAIPAHTTLPRRQVRKRRRRKALLRDLVEVLAPLRDETRKV